MSSARFAVVDRIADMEKKVASLGYGHFLGAVIDRTLEVMKTLAMEGIQSETLPFVLESMRSQLNVSMRHDYERDKAARSIMYGLVEVIGLAIESSMEIGGQPETTWRGEEEEEEASELLEIILEGYKSVAEIETRGSTIKEETPIPEFTAENNEESDIMDTSAVSSTHDTCAADTVLATDATEDCDSSDSDSRRPFPCIQCTSRFSRHRDLLKHITAAHNPKYLHVCSICSRRFRYPSHLRDHKKNCDGSGSMRVPTSAKKPHACHLCDWSFDRPKKLEIHMLTHYGKRPHVCSLCPLDFPSTSALKCHERDIHRLKPYPCMCGKGFGRLADLNKHKKKEVEAACYK